MLLLRLDKKVRASPRDVHILTRRGLKHLLYLNCTLVAGITRLD